MRWWNIPKTSPFLMVWYFTCIIRMYKVQTNSRNSRVSRHNKFNCVLFSLSKTECQPKFDVYQNWIFQTKSMIIFFLKNKSSYIIDGNSSRACNYLKPALRREVIYVNVNLGTMWAVGCIYSMYILSFSFKFYLNIFKKKLTSWVTKLTWTRRTHYKSSSITQ